MYRIHVAQAIWMQVGATEGGKPRSMSGRLSLHVVARPPDARRRDLDNTLKALQDALAESLGFDDSQIDELTVVRGEQVAGGQVVVTIRQLGE